MAGMRALGRVYNIVPVASGVPIDMTQCSGIGFLATNTITGPWTLTFTATPGFTGTPANVTPANGFGQPGTWYQMAASGTSAWTAQAASWASNVLTIAGTTAFTSYVDFLCSEMADTYNYLICTKSAAVTSLVAILYDLDVQRTPQNLKIVSS